LRFEFKPVWMQAV